MNASILEPEQLITGNGWLLANYRQVHCAYVGPELDDEAYHAHLDQLAADIQARSTRHKIGVLYYAPETKNMDASRRRALAKVLEDHKEQLAQSTAAYALATNSTFVRGVLSTVFWLAPPPYPYKVVATPEQGIQFIGEHLMFLDRRALLESFLAQLDHHGLAQAS
ncbi:hypothetical protein G6O69_32200 [Pseudenhygromyxa sp. WMMC2535]|uniref:hypothetical protein n=1 Tax=Pseudenhygromyxa sp. WMMC2535 TaxID=2712867 RepID=UPI001554E313|nr:hypothetical protein [Pseudenhygromyxa sp. WMMC2535]NVB42530.1 hypothetical protein [Pseudenhygromyxa sp. WMMC2535]